MKGSLTVALAADTAMFIERGRIPALCLNIGSHGSGGIDVQLHVATQPSPTSLLVRQFPSSHFTVNAAVAQMTPSIYQRGTRPKSIPHFLRFVRQLTLNRLNPIFPFDKVNETVTARKSDRLDLLERFFRNVQSRIPPSKCRRSRSFRSSVEACKSYHRSRVTRRDNLK